MRKFYLFGSSNVKRSVILMALAAGTFHGAQAQCNNTPNAGPCTGGNVTANFNSSSAQFSSSEFTYDATNGYFIVNSNQNTTNTISSGVFSYNGGTGATVGFTWSGLADPATIQNITISIVNAGTGVPYISCTRLPNSFVAPNQACVTFGGLSIGAGTPIRYVISFRTDGGAASAGTIIFDNFANGGAATPLPVKLDNFDAAKEGNGIKLTWRTDEESGVAVYQVQRSTDGVNFSTIGTVTAEGRKSYSYLDLLPSSGSNFYRLRIMDVDNSVKISHVVSLRSKVAMTIEAYPNPVRDRMVVQHPKAVSGTRLQLVSLTGQVLRDVAVPVNAVVTPMEVTGLSNGTYYVVFRSGAESFSQRITKQ
jgi:hypothetical protein